MCARENDTITTLAHLFVVWSGRPRTRRAPLEPRIIRVPRNKRRLRLALKFASARFICCSNIAVHRAALCADIQFIRNRGREPEARLSPHCGHSVWSSNSGREGEQVGKRRQAIFQRWHEGAQDSLPWTICEHVCSRNWNYCMQRALYGDLRAGVPLTIRPSLRLFCSSLHRSSGIVLPERTVGSFYILGVPRRFNEVQWRTDVWKG